MNSAIKTPWKKAVRVEPSKDYRVHVTMEDDERFELDLTPLISNREAFWRLKNDLYFRKVAVDPLGGLCWPGARTFLRPEFFIICVLNQMKVEIAGLGDPTRKAQILHEPPRFFFPFHQNQSLRNSPG